MIGQTLALSSPELLQSLSLCDTSSRIPADMKHLWDERIATVRGQGHGAHGRADGRALVHAEVHRDAQGRHRARPGDDPAHAAQGLRRLLSRHQGARSDDRLKAITLRTLIIVGAQDMGTPLAASQAINQQIKGSELVVLDPASHLSNLEQPEAFTGALEAFLKRLR